MNYKTGMGVLIILFFMALPASAKQSSKPSSPKQPITAEDIIAKMKIQLELTDQQVEEVRPIIVDHLAKEKQLMLEEKKELSHVLTEQQLYTWNFLQNDHPSDKKKHTKLF